MLLFHILVTFLSKLSSSEWRWVLQICHDSRKPLWAKPFLLTIFSFVYRLQCFPCASLSDCSGNGKNTFESRTWTTYAFQQFSADSRQTTLWKDIFPDIGVGQFSMILTFEMRAPLRGHDYSSMIFRILFKVNSLKIGLWEGN